jgi:hypothetical protein
VIIATKDQSLQWMHAHATERQNQTLKKLFRNAVKLILAVLWNRKCLRMAEIINAWYRNNIDVADCNSEQKQWNADIRYTASTKQCASAYEYSYVLSRTAGEDQLGCSNETRSGSFQDNRPRRLSSAKEDKMIRIISIGVVPGLHLSPQPSVLLEILLAAGTMTWLKTKTEFT